MLKRIFTQEELLHLFVPILRERGSVFQKNKGVFAKVAAGGEQVSTITNDGKETQNTANSGDFIVKNQTGAGEEYIVQQAEFHKRYQPTGQKESGLELYASSGQIIAVELTETLATELSLPRHFQFFARWGKPMVAKTHDFLAMPPDFSEIYRIARKEFRETYFQPN